MAERTVPILPSRDLRETLAFYEALGFENRGAPFERWDYLIIGRGELELHFFGAPDVDRSGNLVRVGSAITPLPARPCAARDDHARVATHPRARPRSHARPSVITPA